MNLMRGPKEEVIEEVIEEEKFGPMKQLAATVDEPPPPVPAIGDATRDHSLEKSPTPHSSGEDSGETTAEEGTEEKKEEQVTLQDLLGYYLKKWVSI